MSDRCSSLEKVFHHDDSFQEEIDILSLPKTRSKKINDDAAMVRSIFVNDGRICLKVQ